MISWAKLKRVSPSEADPRPQNAPQPIAQPAPVIEPEPLRMPLFGEALTHLSHCQRRVVMDFAPASSTGLKIFNDLNCRLDIVDFPSVIPHLAKAKSEAEFCLLLDRLLPARPMTPPNLVLCWDSLNYLPRPLMSLLMQHLAARLYPGAQLHALIAYSSPTMPARPCRYIPLDSTTVRMIPRDNATRQAPRYTPKDLLRSLPGFRIERAMLLRNGMQEFILRLESPAPQSSE